MRKLLILITILLMQTAFSQVAKPTITSFNQGTPFTCITIDNSGTLWAGTDGKGLWKSNIDTASQKIKGFEIFSNDESFNKKNLQTIIAKTKATITSIWVGSNGLKTGTASGGGVHLFFANANGKPALNYQAGRNKVLANAMKLPELDGIPSRNCKALAIDKYGNMWSAHGYHDLTVLSAVSPVIDFLTGLVSYQDPPGYYVTPGGLGSKPDGQIGFKNVTMDKMPYPAYTINTPIQKTPGTRQCVSVACSEYETWMGYGSYEIDPGGDYIYSGIAKFNFNGQLTGYINANNTPELPFTQSFASPRAIAIHFQKNENAWVAFNQNKGFAVYKDAIYTTAKWVYVDKLNFYDTASKTTLPSKLLPNGIKINSDAPQVIYSAGQRVFIGTQDGLLVYKGKGDYKQDSSYSLITIADGLSSNNIKSVAANVKNVYAASDKGINEIFIPSDVVIYHVKDNKKPLDDKDGNYQEIASLTSKDDLNITYTNKDLPMIAADASRVTVFRYYTTDFEGFYKNKYGFGINADYEVKDTAKYGKFELKPKDKYNKTDSSYVDFIYRHPSYLEVDLLNQKKDIVYNFSIYDKTKAPSAPIFNHPIKFVLPPLLMVHGVWTSIESFKKMEEYLKQTLNLQNYQLLRIFRKAEEAKNAEKPWSVDVQEIPKGIKQLLQSCTENGCSAGKINIIAHSRGGLFTRAYVQGLSKVSYNDDINALITLNTPHSGSQLANLVLDERKFPVVILKRPSLDDLNIIEFKDAEISLGEIASVASVPEGDRKKRVGASMLRVHKDLIVDLNTEIGIQRFKDFKIPFHAIAPTFENCKLSTSACSNLLKYPVVKKATKGVWALRVLLFLTNTAPDGLDNLIKNIFNGEKNDFIVPKSSMEAGLDSKYISSLEGKNISHSNLPWAEPQGFPGATESPFVHDKLVDLLKQNVHDDNGNFTTKGINPKRGTNRLVYNFLPELSNIGTNPPPEHGKIKTFNKDDYNIVIDGNIINKSFKAESEIQCKITSKNINKYIMRIKG